MDRPLVLLGEDTTLPASGPLYFWLHRYEATRSAAYQGSPPDNGRSPPNELAPRTVVRVGDWGCAYRSRRWITRMLGRVDVYTYTCQTPWLIVGSQSVRACGRSQVLAMLVLRLDWLTWLLVWQKLYLPYSSLAHKRNLTCDTVSDGSNTAWSLHVWI
jgi:hypothetical protein